jgi:uncharacterized membrane protein
MSTSGSSIKVLFVGESWIKHTIHMKGFDQFHSTEYEEGAGVRGFSSAAWMRQVTRSLMSAVTRSR